MKKFLVFILFLVVIVVGLVFTCPTKQQHVDAVMNEVNGLMSDAASDVGLDTDSGWGMVGKMAIGSLAQNYLESQLYYNNYFVGKDEGKTLQFRLSEEVVYSLFFGALSAE